MSHDHETEQEELERRKVEALERIAVLLESLVDSIPKEPIHVFNVRE